MKKILGIILVLIFSFGIVGSVFGEESKNIFNISIEYPDDKLLEVSTSNKDVSGLGIDIVGNIFDSVDVDKIDISFNNNDSNFPDDVYLLRNYNKGDKKFIYKSYKIYETLDFGKNVYKINLHTGDKVNTTIINIDIFKIKSKKLIFKDLILSKKELNKNLKGRKYIKQINSIVSELKYNKLKTIYLKLDKVNLNSTKIKKYKNILKYFKSIIGIKIYNKNVRGLKINNNVNINLSCENLTSILANNIDGWFFWNSCKPIYGEKGVSFYVIRLENESFLYEKHYYIKDKGIYGIQFLEKGIGVSENNISQKNEELKYKNNNYPSLEFTDNYFNNLIK